MELIRYIHLNPLRAGIVKDLKGLDKYPWTGHSVILGRRKNPLIPEPPDNASEKSTIGNRKSEMSLAERTTQDVLLHFGETVKVAWRRYRDFVEKGIAQGTRPELQGGGLVRSAGGDKRGLLGRKKEEREKGDERILGSGDFACPVKCLCLSYFTGVNEALMKAGKDWEKGKKKRMPLAQLIGKVASHLDLKEASIISDSRKREVSDARGIICCLAVKELGYSAAEVANALDLRRVSAGQCVVRGEKILNKDPDLRDKLSIN